jgi:Rv0078B-related antitoxin
MQLRQPVVEIIDPIIIEILRKKTPAQRLEQAFNMWETACCIVRGAVRQQHPEFSEAEVLRESARRLSHGATENVRR